MSVTFQRAFALLVRRRGETFSGLQAALAKAGLPVDRKTLRRWSEGDLVPSHKDSLAALALLELRWNLPAGYFQRLLPATGRAVRGGRRPSIPAAHWRRLIWHLPDDFAQRSLAEQSEILEWVRRVVVSRATAYRRHQARTIQVPFALRFPTLRPIGPRAETRVAPPELEAELTALVAYKTAPLTPLGYCRRTAWRAATARQKVQHLGLVFGALSADPAGPVKGLGAPLDRLCLGMLTVPRVWDRYLGWRLERRGFFTAWELDLLHQVSALSRPETGWFAQRPDLARRLTPIEGMVYETDIAAANADWAAHCARLRGFARTRLADIRPLARAHNDPFEAILPVLEAERPVAEYRKIIEEILRHRPLARHNRKAAAESSRSLLMIRLGLHLGFRQRNLRELLFARKGAAPRPESELAHLARGELRWSEPHGAWEVFAPAAAFKNAHSRFFSGGAFQLALPNLAGLYAEIEAYLNEHRAVLLGPAPDPGAFFVKTATARTRDASYGENAFYTAWRTIISRHGIYNPWTGRGAIEGLLPHGPHAVRDVLATHILKQTGSYEQASYAIQDSPQTLRDHYARFLPQQKSAIAARLLNAVWEDAPAKFSPR